VERTTNLKSRIALLLVGLSLLWCGSGHAFPLSPDAAPIRGAVSYLKAGQQDDGGFGPGGVTEWVMIAVAAAGQDPREWKKNGLSPLDYLRKQAPTGNPYDWIRMTLALTAVNENPRCFHQTDYVEKIKKHYRDGQFGDPLSLRDDYWAVIALASAGEKGSPEVRASVRFIIEHQNGEGSWSASVTGIETCADNTAAAVAALVAAGQNQASEPIAKALEYLRKTQRPDGGFPYLFMPSNTASDCWVLQALSAAGKDPSEWSKGGETLPFHLLSLQQPDGSFKWMPHSTNSALLMTAYAVPALLGKPYPVSLSRSWMVTADVRIEGEKRTLLHTQITLGPPRIVDSKGIAYNAPFPTALSAVQEAAEREKVPIIVEKSNDTLYLKSLGGEGGGWQYRVNDLLPMVAANDFRLKGGDEVVWFYDYHGCKSPLRVRPERLAGWAGENILVRVDHYSDETGRWQPARGAILVSGSARYPVAAGEVAVPFPRAGIYDLYAEKEGAIRSVRKAVEITEVRPVTIMLRIEDGGRLLWYGKVTFSGFEKEDLQGRKVTINRPVLIGALEAASRQGAIRYRTLQTAQGLILVSINDLVENNSNGSWWYEVNGKYVEDNVDEYLLHGGDTLLIYRGKHPRGGGGPLWNRVDK